ncbi:MAG: hypothetical protein PHU34_11760 [Candidatus Methanoperedens sp.]|nr:hypothetical protein [Candidatus Methanoperedens sp.]
MQTLEHPTDACGFQSEVVECSPRSFSCSHKAIEIRKMLIDIGE